MNMRSLPPPPPIIGLATALQPLQGRYLMYFRMLWADLPIFSLGGNSGPEEYGTVSNKSENRPLYRACS